MPDCVFCQIVVGSILSDPVFENEEIIAFRDINPKAPTHILVVPKKHIPSLASVMPEDEGLLGRMLLVARQIAEDEGLTGTGFRVIINNGLEAGQEVDHIHIHLLGGRKLGVMG